MEGEKSMNADSIVNLCAIPIETDGVRRILFRVEGIDSTPGMRESLLRMGREMAIDLGWANVANIETPVFSAVGIIDSFNVCWEIGLFFSRRK